MGNESDNGTFGDQEDGGIDTTCQPPSLRPVPPPEAFLQVDGPDHFHEQNFKKKINNEHEASCEQSNRQETSIAPSSAMSSPQRPSLLIRRQSSIFGRLPIRNRSRLFDDIVSSNCNSNNNNNNNDDVDRTETMMTSATNFARSQSTWLQEDHQSALIGERSKIHFSDESKSHPSTEDPRPQDPKRVGNSSLFGAVMRQFSSSISSALPAPPSSPFGNGRKKSNSITIASPQKNGSSGSAGGFRGLMASPSGKTIMNIVNQFNSPFKFQSPSSSHKKRQRRRRLWSDNDDADDDSKSIDNVGNEKDGEVDAFATPKKRRRLQMSEEDENSKPTSSNLFPDHNDTNNDSRSSLGGGLVDEYWREAPIIDTDVKTGDRMEVLDWSLVTKMRMEVHGGTRQRSVQPVVDTWIRDALRENDEALYYWTYQSPVVIDGSVGTPQGLGLLAQTNSSSNLAVLQKSIATTKTSMSRHGSFSSRLDIKLQNSKNKSNNKKSYQNDSSSSTQRLAKYLIQLVRGPDAKYSRKRVLEENSLWDEQMLSVSTTSYEDTIERSKREWQQSLRSLFSNFRHRVLRNNDPRESLNAIVLDTYFYCVGQDHSVLFRIADSSDSDSDSYSDINRNKIKAVPVVLVSSTSDAFRKQLISNGMNSNHCSDSDASFQLLESIQERESRERKKIAAAAAAVRKNKRIFDNVLLSPGVRADLEALRRAQAFGESAGADVFVKVKKSGAATEDIQTGKSHLPKAIRVSGWRNVSLFLEVYLNLFGDAMGTCNEAAVEKGAFIAPSPFRTSKTRHKRLPLLYCPNAKDLGPFEHASLKRLRLLPAKRTTVLDTELEKKENKEVVATSHANAIEICGIILPCMIRKLLLVIRNRILEDEKISSATNLSSTLCEGKQTSLHAQSKNDDSDSSRYIVLHSTRPAIANNYREVPKSLIGGLNGSLIFNQGKRRKTKPKVSNENHSNGKKEVFECSYGKVFSMTVWDTSRIEVAACKLDSAFPDTWFLKK